MPLFQKAAFHTTVARLRDLPSDSRCEIAFAGRSNSGKSSAINTLANHSRLAFVSKTPGRTQHLNYFRLAEGKYFVDLPGYGFARAPEEIRAQWEGLLAPYLQQREPLCGLVLIMDSRHPLTELDRQMLAWFAPTGKPIHVLLSKADKLTSQEQIVTLREVRKELAVLAGKCSLQLFSSLKKSGVAEAECVLAAWLGLDTKADTPRSGSAGDSAARPRMGGAIGNGVATAACVGADQEKETPGKGGAGGKTCLTGIRRPLREVKREMVKPSDAKSNPASR